MALAEVIEKINDLFSGDHPDSSAKSVVTHVKERLEESETLQEQSPHNSLAQFSASPELHIEFMIAVIGAMASSEDLSTQIINNPDLPQKLRAELVPVIYETLTCRPQAVSMKASASRKTARWRQRPWPRCPSTARPGRRRHGARRSP